MTGLAGPAELRDRVEAHEPRGLAAVAGTALAVGTYAAWIAGDYVGPALGLVVFGGVAAYLLVGRPTARAVVARALLLLAGLVLATPLLLNLPVLTAAQPGLADRAGSVVHPGVLLLWVPFAVVAGVLALAGRWVGGS